MKNQHLDYKINAQANICADESAQQPPVRFSDTCTLSKIMAQDICFKSLPS